jgi:hypothetical protein
MSIQEIQIADLTQATVVGEGVFDVLMRATKAHLDEEFKKNRITGPEYSTVYLGSVQQVMQTSLEFLVSRQRIGLEAELLKQQIILAEIEVTKANAAVRLAEKQIELAALELQIQAQNLLKIPAEIAHIQAQTGLTVANTQKVPAEKAQIEAQTLLINQQHTNAQTENLVLQAQKCKLDAEFDLIGQNVLKTGAETTLLGQKTTTERAQVSAMGVDEDSVIGRQKRLYFAQTEGFARDAEQKAAKIFADSWGIRRSTDEGELASATNKLDDATVGRAMSKLLAGINA